MKNSFFVDKARNLTNCGDTNWKIILDGNRFLVKNNILQYWVLQNEKALFLKLKT